MITSVIGMLCCTAAGKEVQQIRSGPDDNLITFEMGRLIRAGEIEMTFNHSINKKWSISFSSTSAIKKRKIEKEMAEHDNSFIGEDTNKDMVIENGKFRNHICAQFWPKDVYDGPYISIGIGHDFKMNFSQTLSVGYMFTIFKALKGSVGYRAEVLELLKYDDRSGCHATIGISLSF